MPETPVLLKWMKSVVKSCLGGEPVNLHEPLMILEIINVINYARPGAIILKSVIVSETPAGGQCMVNPCVNGGSCTSFLETYRCHCPKGFKGRHCEGKIANIL